MIHLLTTDIRRKHTFKAYKRFIQPMTNMKMWPKSDTPAIEPPEITSMLESPKIGEKIVMSQLRRSLERLQGREEK